MTFLGVETSPVPAVLCEQMNLSKGFGLVVDYVVPDGPASAAGVQQNDILKMLNDQILMEPGQLSKLIRSFSEGTTVTLTVLRKGQEQKVSVKLSKKEVPKRNAFGPGMHDFDFHFDHDMGNVDLGDLKDRLKDMKENLNEQLGNNDNLIHDTVVRAQAEAQRVRDAAQRMRDQAQRQRDEVQRQRDAIQRTRDEARNTGQITVNSSDGSKFTATRIDLGKAQIVFSDEKGELRIDAVDGKKVLTAKDPQGRLLFGGPVDTQEEIDKIPEDVRKRFETLQDRDLRSVIAADDEDDNGDEDLSGDDGDDDEGADDDDSGGSVEQVSTCPYHGGVMRNVWMFRTVFI